MTDFWRAANVIIAIAIIVVVVLAAARRRRKTRDNTKPIPPLKRCQLLERKQRLIRDLEIYEENVNRLENESRQMMDEYFAKQELYVNKLVKTEADLALQAMEAEAEASVKQSFEKAKNRLQQRFE